MTRGGIKPGAKVYSPLLGWLSFVVDLRLDHLTAAQTGSADANALGGPAHLGPYGPQVDVPPPLGHVVRVADVIPKLRPFAANLTNLCH